MSKKHVHAKPVFPDVRLLLEADNLDDEEQETFHHLLDHIFTGTNHHMQIAIQLTELVFAKTSTPNLTAEQIFSIYREAVKTVTESSPLPSLLTLMGPEVTQ